MGFKLGTKDIEDSFFTASLLPLNNLKKVVKKENLISLEINLVNLKLDMEGIIKTIRGMIIELVNTNGFRM